MCRKISLIFFVLIAFGYENNNNNVVNGEPKVPCYFIFGDSLSDSGNNNELITKVKANYSPYGVDFPSQTPTGRFTNGRNIVDFISQFLGFGNFISPYSTRMDKDILRGINFASGAAGILAESGSHLGDRIWMDRQLQNYERAIFQLQSMLQNDKVDDHLNKCLYTINIGANDYIFNYLMPQYYNSSKIYTVDQYAELLIGRFSAQLQVLYNFGARKIAIFGVGNIGCTPLEMAKYNATQCVEEVNQAAEVFNNKLVSLVDSLNANLVEAKFTFINISAMQSLIPLPPGFVTNSTCCKLSDDFLCEPNSQPCVNRDMYQFMDGLHPTQVLNRIAANTSYYSPLSLSFVHPMSISQLVSSN